MLKHTNNAIGVVILAAGDGKRMQSDLPKVMHELHGMPLIGYVVTAVEKSGIADKIVVVVSPKHTLVQDYLGERAEYIVQEQQRGTGHAVGVARDVLTDCDDVVVLYGDMPCISEGSLRELVLRHTSEENTMTMATTKVSDFLNENSVFSHFSRIIRDEFGLIIKDVQVKDATEEELGVKELNPSFYCFRASWLWKHIVDLKNNNAQKEMYLTDLIGIAIALGERVGSLSVNQNEAIGISTKEDIEKAQKCV